MINKSLITKNSNLQDLIKLLAIILMNVDHYGMYLLPDEQIYRALGRFALPIFTFYAGYNFKLSIRHSVWIWAVILIGLHLYFFNMFLTNILVTIALGQLYLVFTSKMIIANESVFFIHFILMICLTPLTDYMMDYGTLGIAIMMVGYLYKRQGGENKGYLMFAIIALAIFNEYTMSKIFHNFYYALLSLLMHVLAYSLLKYAKHDKPFAMPIAFKWIARNILYVYSISIIAFLIVSDY